MDRILIEGKSHTYAIIRSEYAPVESNMYVLCEGREAIVFDSNVSDNILDFLNDNDVKKVHLFLTHEHYDHSHGITWFREHFNTTLYCHKKCLGQLSTKTISNPRLVAFVLSAKDMNDGGSRYEDFKRGQLDYDINADVYLDDFQECKLGSHFIKVIYTPGHSPGSCIYIVDDELLFSGDTLIKNHKVITSFRGGNRDSFVQYTLPKLKALSDDLIVLPGHGDVFTKNEFDFNIYA